MPYVLLLISARESRAVSDAVAARISALEAVVSAPVWLEPQVACEFALPVNEPASAKGIGMQARAAIGEAPVDAAIVASNDRRKKLLLADMDSTFIGEECIDEVGAMCGLGPEIAQITERAMRGELDFESALKERVALMKGVDYDLIEDVKRERISFTSGGRTAVRTMTANGAYTALVSGGFSDFTTFVAEQVGFDDQHANSLIIEDGRLAGLVAEPVLGRDAKLQLLRRFCSERGLDASEVIAVGDGANDVEMLKAAGLGVAFHPKPIVAEAADVVIRHADLTALLFLQGYRSAEFTE